MQQILHSITEIESKLDNVSNDKKEIIFGNLAKLTKKLLEKLSAFCLVPEDFSNKIYPAITLQIQAGEKRTEKAADDIMGAAEKIMNAASALDGDVKNTIMTEVNTIFEACSFQDLVAQHLNEIRLCVEDIHADMENLKGALEGAQESGKTAIPKKQKRPDAHLLNGPPTNI